MIARVQHPKIHIDATANRNYFFRYRTDPIQPDGTQKAIRMRHVCGPSKGPKKISLKDAEMIRDDELRKINAPNVKIAAAKGQALFGEVANMYLTSHVDRRGKMAAPSREKEKWMVKALLLSGLGEAAPCRYRIQGDRGLAVRAQAQGRRSDLVERDGSRGAR